MKISVAGPIRIDLDEQGHVVLDVGAGALVLPMVFPAELARRIGLELIRAADLSDRGVRSTKDGPHRILEPDPPVRTRPKLRIVRDEGDEG